MNYPKRKDMRLKGFDYTQKGGYFITICTDEKRCILSVIRRISEGQRPMVILTELGRILKNTLCETANRYDVMMDAFVIMPNHVHILLFLDENSKCSVGQFIGAVKSIAANQWRKNCKDRKFDIERIWQRNYYDHILRNEADYLEKRKYIDENADKWAMDEMYCPE